MHMYMCTCTCTCVPDGSCVMIPVSCSLVTSDGSGGLSERALPLVKVNPTNGRWRVRAVKLGGAESCEVENIPIYR